MPKTEFDVRKSAKNGWEIVYKNANMKRWVRAHTLNTNYTFQTAIKVRNMLDQRINSAKVQWLVFLEPLGLLKL